MRYRLMLPPFRASLPPIRARLATGGAKGGVCLIGILFGLGLPIMAQESETPVAGTQAKEKLIQAFENTAQSKNYRIEGKMSTEMGSGEEEEEGFQMEATFKGINKTPDLSYITVEAMGQKMEIYRQGDDAVAKNPMTDEWMKMPGAQPGFMPADQIALFKEHLKDARLAGAEQINQKDCVVIEASLIPEGIAKLMEKQQALKMVDMAKTNIEIKAWCGKEDALLYKIVILTEVVMEVGPGVMPIEESEEEPGEEVPQPMTMKMSMEITFSDYDKEIKFEIPDEVKKALATEEEEEFEEEEIEEEEIELEKVPVEEEE